MDCRDLFEILKTALSVNLVKLLKQRIAVVCVLSHLVLHHVLQIAHGQPSSGLPGNLPIWNY